MIGFNIENATSSGRQRIYGRILSTSLSDVSKYVSCNVVRNACKTGCVNYEKKWSCPPFSRTFYELSLSYREVIVMCLYINLSDMSYIDRGYQKVKAANAILKSKGTQIARHLEMELNGLALLNGSCNLCKPCYKKNNLPCNRPEKMRYSMESTGIDVCSLLSEVMHFDLQWYKSGHTPECTSVACCVLYNNESASVIEECMHLMCMSHNAIRVT